MVTIMNYLTIGSVILIPIAGIIFHATFLGSSKYDRILNELQKGMGKSFTQNPYRAVVYGGTGAIGSALLKELLLSPKCEQVIAVTRRPIQWMDEKLLENNEQRKQHEQMRSKLKEIILPQFEEQIYQNVNDDDNQKIKQIMEETRNANVVFNCMGTTRAKAGSAQKFIQWDKDLTIRSADLTVRAFLNEGYNMEGKQSLNHLTHRNTENANIHYSIVTSIGSDKHSMFLYPRTKGEIEYELSQMNFGALSIFRPSLLITSRNESRFGESIFQFLAPTLDMLLFNSYSPFSNYQSILVQQVARAMRHDFEQSFGQESKQKIRIYENHQIHQLSKI